MEQTIQGKGPRIAIIDTDVEGFNLSSLCGTLDDKKNILSSLYGLENL